MNQQNTCFLKRSGFIPTFISVCSGTERFPELIKQPFWRAYAHLIILALLCSFINVALQLHPFNKSFEECCANLNKRFGEISFTSQGIVPTIEPDKARSATSISDFRVDYLPDVEALKAYRPKSEFQQGILWTPKSVLFWRKNEANDYWVTFPLIFSKKDFMINYMEALQQWNISHIVGRDPLLFLKMGTLGEIPPQENLGNAPIAFRDFKIDVLLGFAMRIPTFFSIMVFSDIMVQILIGSMLYILFFSAFSYWFGRANILRLRFLELFATGIYTAFPGLVIASLVQALRIPFLDFQSIFLISYFVYSFAVFARLRKTFLPPPPKQDSDKYEF